MSHHNSLQWNIKCHDIQITRESYVCEKFILGIEYLTLSRDIKLLISGLVSMEIGDKYQARIYFAHSLQKAGLEISQPFKYNK